MAFTKLEMQEQLALFIQGYAASVDRMLSTDLAEMMESPDGPKTTLLWSVSSKMYDYGISGIPLAGLGAGEVVDAEHADVELFLTNIELLENYLEEDSVILPWRAKRAVQTAIARHVLEGGERYLCGEGDQEGYLSLVEVALLADMDERSVRNAASNKADDSLRTEKINKRTMVSVEEARRWLPGRNGFIPTKRSAAVMPSMCVLSLPVETAVLLEQKALKAGLSVADYLERQLALE